MNPELEDFIARLGKGVELSQNLSNVIAETMGIVDDFTAPLYLKILVDYARMIVKSFPESVDVLPALNYLLDSQQISITKEVNHDT
ncbi:MAG: hypothetical protein LUC17_00670 [Oscillospiraceae bacterium]|nr:hypothetical protein [Oscillospiraceae bacterium]